MDRATWSVGLETAFETLGLAARETESPSALVGGQTALDQGFAGFVALDLVPGELQLQIDLGQPPCGLEASGYVAGVVFSLWR